MVALSNLDQDVGVYKFGNFFERFNFWSRIWLKGSFRKENILQWLKKIWIIHRINPKCKRRRYENESTQVPFDVVFSVASRVVSSCFMPNGYV
jgi:hypothetical protein